MSHEICFKIRGRDDRGTDWTLTLPNVQGLYSIVIPGHFRHQLGKAFASSVNTAKEGTCNGQTFKMYDLLELVGNTCMDRGEEVVESVLAGVMRDDFDDWETYQTNLAFEEYGNQRLHNAHYQRNAI